MIFAHRLHQTVGSAYPVKGRKKHQGNMKQNGHEESGNQPHVVVKRKPADDDIIG